MRIRGIGIRYAYSAPFLSQMSQFSRYTNNSFVRSCHGEDKYILVSVQWFSEDQYLTIKLLNARLYLKISLLLLPIVCVQLNII